MDRIARNIGRGLAAGLLGTAAMTVSSTLEAKLRGRGASTTPPPTRRSACSASAASTPMPPSSGSTSSSTGVGTAWGAVRGLLRAFGLGPRAATGAHLALVYGGEQVMLPALGVAPPATHWGDEEVGVDALHHTVYVLATARAFEWLRSRGEDA